MKQTVKPRWKDPANVMDISLLRQLIKYDPDTGDLTWLPRPAEMFSDVKGRQEGSCQRWNKVFANTAALSSLTKKGALAGSIFAKSFLAHRVAWALHSGKWPDGEIDHINGIRTDNRVCNLRDVTKSDNQRNAARRKDNKSGYAGVYKYKNRYIAHIRIGGKMKILGRFDTAIEAHNFRQTEKLKYGFHPNHGRN